MLKRVQTSELRTGMYIHDLDCGWLDHPFVANEFLIKNAQIIQKIASAGIRHVYIDTSKGKDVDHAPTAIEVEASLQEQIEKIANKNRDTAPTVSASEEMDRAKQLYRQATSIVRNLMEDARLGKQVSASSLDPVAEKMVQSAFRNHHAISGITRIKTKDEYTFMHCVGVAGLLAMFGKEMQLPEDTVHQLTVGGLIHDIGKALTPDKILNKPDKLSDKEFAIMKHHVTHSRRLLDQCDDVSQIARDVTLLHHERLDGTGYPLNLKGEKISEVGRMSAIVDVYDALTSVRVYKQAWEPTRALRKLLEWSPDHFDHTLVEHFIRCLGIYPVGSMVELESGKVGIVMEQNDDLLRPQVRVIYNANKKCYEKIHDIDLSRNTQDRVKSPAMPEMYKIDLLNFL